MENDTLPALLPLLESDNWNIAVNTADAIATFGQAALPGLLPLLASPSSQTRRAVAIALREIGNDGAVLPLIAAINNPLTAGTRGDLVWALQTHCCVDHFCFLFELALNDTYEVQTHTLTILSEQEFWYDEADLDQAQVALDQYVARQAQPADTADLIAELRALLADLREQAR